MPSGGPDKAGYMKRVVVDPPFTPGYELVGVVEELGPGRTRLQADKDAR